MKVHELCKKIRLDFGDDFPYFYDIQIEVIAKPAFLKEDYETENYTQEAHYG